MTQITDTLEINYVAQYLHHWYSIKPERIVCINKEWHEDYGGWEDEYYFVTYKVAASDWYDEQYMIRVLVNEVDDHWSNEKDGK